MFSTSQWHFFQRFFIGLLCCLSFFSITHAQHRDNANVISVSAPVWTEELGEVPLDKYTEKELAQMVWNYWTPERMRKAIPVERTIKEALMPGENRNRFPPAQEAPEIFLSLPASMERGKGNVAKSNEPIYFGKSSGKVFYLDPGDGRNYVCSGAAINSSSKRIVATAAHCVHSGGAGGNWYQNWYFVPDYIFGWHPYGYFPAAFFWALPEWVNQTTFYQGNNSDVSFVTTHVNADDLRVVEAVGGHGISYGGSYDIDVKIFGYPLNLQNGENMWSCTGSTYQRWASGYGFLSINGCNFGQGASGGPWLTQYSTSTGEGILRGITSWISCWNDIEPCNSVKHINSPYFSNNIINLFNNANSADW